jgi:putative oxidoreductase
MNALTTVVARVLFALPFGVFGVLHFTSVARMSELVPLPGAEYWLYLTGAALIAGCLGMIFKVQAKWASLGLAALMFLFAVFVHGRLALDPAQTVAQVPQVLKDVSLLAGALTWAGIFSRAETP